MNKSEKNAILLKKRYQRNTMTMNHIWHLILSSIEKVPDTVQQLEGTSDKNLWIMAIGREKEPIDKYETWTEGRK